MAIDIEWLVNSKLRKHDETQSRISPHIVNSEVIDDNKLTEILIRHSTYTRGMVEGMLLDLSETMADLLREGKTIEISSLGTFRLSVGARSEVTTASATAERRAKVNGVNFFPSKEFAKSVSKADFRTVARNVSTAVPSAASLVTPLSDYFKTHDSISRTEFAQLFRLKLPTASYRLKELMAMGVIKSIGNNRGTKYVKA